MKKRGILLVVCLILVLSLALVHSSDIRPLNKKSIDSLNVDEEFDVVIKLKQDSFRKSLAFGTIDNSQRVASNLKTGKVTGSFEPGRQVFAKVNREELEMLVNSDEIESINLQRNFTITLSSSIRIINASMIWPLQLNGNNLTGINQSICVIDTGVNYTHPDIGGCYGNNDPSSNCKVIGGYDFINNDADPMDDNGHGTHVAGIASSNGSTYRGVAPGSKVIAIKALNSAGNGNDLGIIKGINWCIGNASRYNIKVISMSLGDDNNYTNYCNSDTLASSINLAVQNNITVVVSSGNEGSYTGISSPACVQNSTSVGWSTKSDTMDNDGSRNSLVDIVAPGTGIVSLYYRGGYAIASGSSMSGPHVAGAFAIMGQFFEESGQKKPIDEIEREFNLTGRLIFDSYSNLNYSRINVNAALEKMSFRYVNLSYPINNANFSTNQNFTCDYASYVTLNNVSFYIWNSTALVYNETKYVSGKLNSSVFYYNFSVETNYSWNCKVDNNLSYFKFGANNFSADYHLGVPSITVNSPLNRSLNAGVFNVSLSEEGSCWYSIDSGANVSMTNLSNNNFYSRNESLIQDQEYNIRFYCNDTIGNYNSTSEILFTAETISPNVSSISPESGYSTTSNSISFSYNVSDNNNLTRCSLIINNQNVRNNQSSLTNGTNTISYSLSTGSSNWKVECEDEAGNIGNSSSRSITIEEVIIQSSSGGGGGGGGGGNTIVNTTTTNSSSGSSGGGGSSAAIQNQNNGVDSYSISKGSKINFEKKLNNRSEKTSHTLVLKDIGKDYVNISIYSQERNLTLYVGEEVKISLDSSDYYDLLLKLESIVDGKANITVKGIYEPVNVADEESIENNSKFYYYVIGFMIVVALIFYLIKKIEFINKHRKLKNKLVEK